MQAGLLDCCSLSWLLPVCYIRVCVFVCVCVCTLIPFTKCVCTSVVVSERRGYACLHMSAVFTADLGRVHTRRCTARAFG